MWLRYEFWSAPVGCLFFWRWFAPVGLPRLIEHFWKWRFRMSLLLNVSLHRWHW